MPCSKERLRLGTESDKEVVKSLTGDFGEVSSDRVHACELAQEEDRLRAPIDFVDARRRFADDRPDAINPVIVEGFLRQLATTEGWQVQTGLAPGILLVSGPRGLQESLGGGKTASVSADGAAVRHAYESTANVSDVKVLGPTEEIFGALVSHASQDYEEHLVRGVAAQDQSSLSDYVVFVWTCEIESDDGIRAERRPFPFLVRYSGTEAFPMDWEAVLKLSAGQTPAQLPPPGTRLAAEDVARQRAHGEQARLATQKRTWVEKAKADLDDIEARYKRQLATYSDHLQPQLRQEFGTHKTERLGQLARIVTVTMPGLRLVGWLQVRGAAAVGQMGWDPDSEKAAVAIVMNDNSIYIEYCEYMNTSVTPDLTAAVQALVDTYVDGWNRGDGTAFANAFAADADFTSIRLDRVQGRDAIGRAHQEIFDTVYKGTRVQAQVEQASVRPLGAGHVEFLVDAHMTDASGAPFGPKHVHHMVVAEQQTEGWRIVAFHNMQPTQG